MKGPDLNVVYHRGQCDAFADAGERIRKHILPLITDDATKKAVGAYMYSVWSDGPDEMADVSNIWGWWVCPSCGKRWHETWSKHAAIYPEADRTGHEAFDTWDCDCSVPAPQMILDRRAK